MDQALWFASRGTGLVSLILLTATLVLGVEHTGRATGSRWPRFTVHAVHRNLSMVATTFLVVHIATATIDPYAGIAWLDAVVPFVSVYKPFYLGLGAIALDLMIAVIVTSMLRTRVPLRMWQWVHRCSYALWPIAVVHGLGAGGKDAGLLWVQAINVLCGAAVAVALWRRFVAPRLATATPPVPHQRRASGSTARSRAKVDVR